LIFRDVAAASTGARSTPWPVTATPAAVALPSLRKSRRDRLMESSLPLGTGELVPCAPYHDDAPRTSRLSFELDDVAGIERLEVRAGALVRDDEGLSWAGQISARLGCRFNSDMAGLAIDGHDDHTVLAEGVREALRHYRGPPWVRVFLIMGS